LPFGIFETKALQGRQCLFNLPFAIFHFRVVLSPRPGCLCGPCFLSDAEAEA
jgi:hypothetical protein